MKKIISILLAAAMVLAFAACGNNSGNNGGNDAAVTDPLEVLSKTWSSLPEEDKFRPPAAITAAPWMTSPANSIFPIPIIWIICCLSQPAASTSLTAPPLSPT